MLLQYLLGPRATLILLDLGTLLAALSLLYGFTKILYQRFVGRPFPANNVTRRLDAANELAVNVLGLLNKLRGGDLITHPDVARRDRVIGELRAALGTYQRAAAAGPAWADLIPTEPNSLRGATLVAGSVPPPPRASGQGGHVTLGPMVTLLAVGTIVMLVLAFAIAAPGCRSVQDLSIRAVHSLPSPTDCRPLVQRCVATPAGVVPVVCSPVPVPGGAQHREWASLPVRADGTHRVCSYGCAVSDAGVAHCTLPAVDAGTDAGAADASVE